MISKKTIKKWPFFAVDPTTSLFQFFFVVLLYHSNRSRSDNQIFHWEKQTFFQLLSVLTMSPRRRCNLTSANVPIHAGHFRSAASEHPSFILKKKPECVFLSNYFISAIWGKFSKKWGRIGNFQNIFLTTSEGRKWMDRPQKYILEKYFLGKNVEK